MEKIRNLFLFILFPLLLFPLDNLKLERKAVKSLLKKDFEGALKFYEEAYKINPKKSSILRNLSNLYILLKKDEKAEELLKKFIEIEPENSYPYKILRLLLLDKKKEFEWLKISSNWYIETKKEEALKALIGARVRVNHFSQAIKLMKKNKLLSFDLKEIKNEKIKEIIFLITLDTFRYDLLNEKITPNLWNLKKESYFFSNFYAVAPITLPAHCSIFTGLYPRHTGVKDNSIYKLNEKAETIPEILKNYGYSSYGFVSSYLLNRRFGLNQGFKIYQDNFIPIDKKSHFPSTRRAFDTVSEAIEFLNKTEEEKGFFFIHLYDTHAPYEPPFPFDEAYPDSLYKGEGAYIDFILGNFFDSLKKSKIYDKAMIIILSDHGESLGEYGEPTHGFLLYNPTLHIPFLLHLPKQNFGKEIDLLSSQVDLLPTILSILKIKNKKIDGEDLFKLEKGRYIFSETEIPLSFNWSSLFKIYKDKYSYILNPSDKLFYLNKKIEDERLKKELKKELENYKKENPFWKTEKEILDEETIKNLRSLGYHQSYINPKEEKNLPNPEEKMKSLILYQRAQSFEEDGNFGELEKAVKELEIAESENTHILSLCAEWYNKIGNKNEALRVIEKALKIDENFAQGWFYLGFLNEEKDKDISIKFYKKAISLEPMHFLARYNLSRLYLIKENYNEAEEEMLNVLKINPENAYTLNNLGYLYYKRYKDCKKAISFIEKAYKLKPEDEQIKLSYSSILKNCGEKK